MSEKTKLKVWVEAALMIGLSLALSVVSELLPFKMPLGGSVTIASMLPIAVLSYRRGMGIGLTGAFLLSLAQLFMGLENLSYAKNFTAVLAIIFFDYILAFTFIGLSGMFRGKVSPTSSKRAHMLWFGAGISVATALRFLCHWLSGAVVWYELTKEWFADDSSHFVFKFGPALYSFLYNIAYMLPELIITVVAGVILCSVLNLKDEKLKY